MRGLDHLDGETFEELEAPRLCVGVGVASRNREIRGGSSPTGT